MSRQVRVEKKHKRELCLPGRNRVRRFYGNLLNWETKVRVFPASVAYQMGVLDPASQLAFLSFSVHEYKMNVIDNCYQSYSENRMR